MTDLPIHFSKPMVLALLAGRKLETRRVLKATGSEQLLCRTCGVSEREFKRGNCVCATGEGLAWTPCQGPRSRVGDRLYVREEIEAWRSGPYKYLRYSVDQHNTFHEWPPEWQRDKARPMHMFRRFSRMTLPVTGVRVERLHDITDAGAIAEGVVMRPQEPGTLYQDWHVPGVEHWDKNFPYLSRTTPREMYAALWDSINGSGTWLANPWVAVTSWSHVIHQNVDKIQP